MQMKQYYVAHVHVTVMASGQNVKFAQYLCGPFGTKAEAENAASTRLFEKTFVPEIVSETVNVHLEE